MHSAVRAYHKVCTMDLRDRLILEHLSYVRHILGKMLGSLPDYVDHENLESAGILGLVEAAGQYDPARGVAFTTFAYQRIRGAILDELRRNCPVPQSILQNWALIRDASTHMDPPLTPEKLASATNLTIREVEDCLAAMRLTRLENWYVCNKCDADACAASSDGEYGCNSSRLEVDSRCAASSSA